MLFINESGLYNTYYPHNYQIGCCQRYKTDLPHRQEFDPPILNFFAFVFIIIIPVELWETRQSFPGDCGKGVGNL